ncbi:hypothetical protein QGX11_gp109 [Pseudomonas phage PPSC2]|uniref:Uncharacterized protein n=1 Tax=Pseudomonas phage PPSC2 TaxID=2041350 RepID=A0A2R2YB21_9CAUD|nr:hypothetical protein QGX11_gp109 [Pseudomonas phage PPSC2]ATN92872.1 hypothetical protein PPSC2_109 [Pseudomonas phage PPSC2]
MNVMAQAHKDTKEYMIERASQKPNSSALLTYRQVFSAMLRNCHWHYKNSQKQKTIKLSAIVATLSQDLNATGFGLQGVVTDSEGNKVNVGEYSGSEMKIQNDADYYMSAANGFSKQELFVVSWGLENSKESFKIIR